ncbi:hypothetical protein [Heliobacterium mobile]|nr:hypothetical protein [Heliobacterium mobile]
MIVRSKAAMALAIFEAVISSVSYPQELGLGLVVQNVAYTHGLERP